MWDGISILDNYSFFIESRQSSWEIDMVAYAYNHNHGTWEADAGRTTRLKPLQLHSECEAILPQKHNTPKGHIELPVVWALKTGLPVFVLSTKFSAWYVIGAP